MSIFIQERPIAGMVLAAAATVALATACTSSDDSAPRDQPGARDTSTAGGRGGDQGADDGVERRRAGRDEATITLGDLNRPKNAKELGAPFDPCTTVTWNDFPAEVRPTDGKPHTPQLRAPDPEDMFDLRCLWDNSGAIAINTDGTSGGAQGGYYMVSVLWTAGDRLEVDPAKREGAEARTWNGKTGLVQPFPDDPEVGKACIGMAKLSSGVGGVSVTDSRFGADPCAAVEALMGAITARAT